MATRPNSRSTTRRSGNTRLSLLIQRAAFRRECRHVTSATNQEQRSKFMNNNNRKKGIALFMGAVSLALSATTNAEVPKSIEYNTASGSQIIITDLGLIPGGTFSSGLAVNNQPVIVGLANDSTFALQRPFWDANTGVIIGFADNFNPASTAIPEHMNESREMGGTEVYGDNVYQGVFWNPTGQAFVLPPLAGFDPVYG